MKRSTTIAVGIVTLVTAASALYAARRLTAPAPPAPPIAVPATDLELPASYADALARLVPIVRHRVGQENARLIAAKDPLGDLPPATPHVDLGGDLWGELALERTSDFVRIPGPQWDRWQTSFETAWKAAVERLAARPRSMKANGAGFFTSPPGEGNGSALVLLPIAPDRKLEGATVFAAPRPGTLLVADGAVDDALGTLADRVVETCEASRESCNLDVWTTGPRGFEPFRPAPSHPLAARFLDLERSAHQARVKAQTALLRQKLGESDDVPFVASLFRVKHPETGVELSYVVHTAGVPTLLPRADYVFFLEDPAKKAPAAIGRFGKVEALMKGRWKKTALYPERWVVDAFPTPGELREIGFAVRP